MSDAAPELSLEVREVGYDHRDAVALVAMVQQEYVARYGGPDAGPTEAAEFIRPRGVFAVGYERGLAVAIGGWRSEAGSGASPASSSAICGADRGSSRSNDRLRPNTRPVGVCTGHPMPTRRVMPSAGTRAELKRMYVRPAARGRGHARSLLGWLEESARDAGHAELVLETGLVQPEAIALYRSSGYADVDRFGYYADSPISVYLGKAL